jgi:WXG100 family type VII secretion target
MIISGTLHLDPAGHAAASTSLGDRLAELDDRRRTAESTVEDLLGTWRGEAAGAFRLQWEAWSRAATAVVDELGTTVDALSGARGDLVGADDRSGSAGDQLLVRLGGRLP